MQSIAARSEDELLKYWIIALPREDMEHCIKVGTFGKNRKSPLDKVERGDGVVCYITKERKIIAIGEVTEGYYLDDSAIFKKEGVFPDRIRFKARQFDGKDEFDFISIIDKLQLVTNIAHWSVYLRTGFVQISQADWNLICSKTSFTLP